MSRLTLVTTRFGRASVSCEAGDGGSSAPMPVWLWVLVSGALVLVAAGCSLVAGPKRIGCAIDDDCKRTYGKSTETVCLPMAEGSDDRICDVDEDGNGIADTVDALGVAGFQCGGTCFDRECGSNGCGGSCGSCGDDEVCVDGFCGEAPCEPSCDGRNCGTDGCGGSCGDCEAPLTCSDDGVCAEVDCAEECLGLECGTAGSEDQCDCGSCDPEGPCISYVCLAGSCVEDFKSGDCDDGDACTLGDVCHSGLCEGMAVPCNDEDPCTADACLDGECVHSPQAGECDDGNLCTDADQCAAGICKGTAIDCEDGNVCTQDSCEPQTGDCVHDASGAVAACDDGIDCTVDSCNGVTGCSHTPASELCDDGVECTVDHCSAILGCEHLVQDNGECDDGFACTLDSCSATQGCTHLGQDELCDDGVMCTQDVCAPGSGCVHITQDDWCEDGNECTLDKCHPLYDCGYPIEPMDGVACSDENACTESDVCQAGMCMGHPVVCDDGNPCTEDLCMPGTGECSFEKAPMEGEPCDDRSWCTGGDRCEAGACSGDIIACDCVGRCGDDDPSAACSCAVDCFLDGTCCLDICDVCLGWFVDECASVGAPVPTCAGACGAVLPSYDCYCDAFCFQAGDCCPDVCTECGATFSTECFSG